MTEFQVAETVEALETQHSDLKKRIARLVDAASVGTNDGAEIPPLAREVAALASRIEMAKAERDRSANAQRLRDRDQARADLVVVRANCLKARDAFLEHYRGACIELSSYLDLQARAGDLTRELATPGFGVPPEDQNNLRALQFSAAPVDLVRVGLTPKIDVDWKVSFPITPMQEQFKTR